MAVTLYLYDEGKNLRGVALWGVQKLIHDERDFLLTAEILNRYAVKSGEYLGFMCKDGRYRLFKAERAVVHTSEGFTTITATEAAVAELARSIVPEVRCTDAEGNEIRYHADELTEMVLAGSGFTLGRRAQNRKGAISQYCAKRWRALRDIESACSVRIIPYYEMNGGRIVRRVVDIEERTYQRTGRILQRETDATSIQIVYTDNAIARMYGVGASIGTEDPPTCVSFKDVSWSKASGDPMDKPAGQMYLENPDVIAMGIDDEDVFENKNITDPHELLRETRKALLERSKPKVSGTAVAFDVEHIPGYEHKGVQIYDILDVPDDSGSTVEAIVIDVQRNYIDEDRTQIVLGNEEEDEATISKMVAKLMNSTVSLRGSAGAASSRYIENKHLIQLNANRIIMNAEEILANADRIRFVAGNLEEYEAGTDARLSMAELILMGDETGAVSGLVSRMENAEGAIVDGQAQQALLSEAFGTFKATAEGSFAAIGARFNDNEAKVETTANELGSKIELKADKTYVDDLVADKIDAVVGDIGLAISNNINTRQISVSGTAEVGALKIGTMPVSTMTLPIVKEFTQALGETAPTEEITLLTVA